MPGLATQELFACLPYVKMSLDDGVPLGPVHFWPVSSAGRFLSESDAAIIQRHIPDKTVTMVSINDEVPLENRGSLLIEAIYQLYFCSAFCHSTIGIEAVSLTAFTKIIPSPIECAQDDRCRATMVPSPSNSEQSEAIICVDEQIRVGIANVLNQIYLPNSEISAEEKKKRLSMLRGIRYFVDRFYRKFESLIGNRTFDFEKLHQPEDIIFLIASFESLLSLTESNPQFELKQQMRSIFALRYTESIDSLWNWIDGLYRIKNESMKGNDAIDIYYRRNPNFTVSYFYLGVHVFLYAVHAEMFRKGLISLEGQDESASPDFTWIKSQNVLIFLWPEKAALKQVYAVLNRPPEKRIHLDRVNFHFFTVVFSNYMKNYYLTDFQNDEHLEFHPTPIEEIREVGEKILGLFESEKWDITKGELNPHPEFQDLLKQRLSL